MRVSRGRWKGRRAESWQSYAGEQGQVGRQESRELSQEIQGELAELCR